MSSPYHPVISNSMLIAIVLSEILELLTYYRLSSLKLSNDRKREILSSGNYESGDNTICVKGIYRSGSDFPVL
jgi:hypothetical protein